MRSVVLLLVLLLASSGRTVSSGPLTLTYASPYGPNHTFSLADRTWIRWVEEHSHGRLIIKPIWSGALLSSDQSMLELRHSVADIGLILPIYTRGGAQLIRAQTGFYGGAKSFAQQVAMYRCLSATSPEFARELSGLKVLAIQGGTLPGLITRTRPVSSLADLKGLRLRAPAELLTVLRELGAAPVDMPMGEVYSALAKGVLDGVVAPADTLKSLHFAEVGKFFWRLEVPRGAYPARAMAVQRWQQLADEDRALLDASTPVWEEALAHETTAAVQAGESAGLSQGVRFEPVLPAEQRKFETLFEAVAGQDAAGLNRYGIDAQQVFQQARQIARGIEATGQVTCGGVAGGSG